MGKLTKMEINALAYKILRDARAKADKHNNEIRAKFEKDWEKTKTAKFVAKIRETNPDLINNNGVSNLINSELRKQGVKLINVYGDDFRHSSVADNIIIAQINEKDISNIVEDLTNKLLS